MSEQTLQSQPSRVPTPAELGFDPADIRSKYAEERSKRLRTEGNSQYQEITGSSRTSRATHTSSRGSRAPRCTKISMS